MSRHECDCGAVYSSSALVLVCAERNHGEPRAAGTDRPFYLRLWLDRYGQYMFLYSSQPNGPWIRLMPITPEQAGWMRSDGWPVVREIPE